MKSSTTKLLFLDHTAQIGGAEISLFELVVRLKTERKVILLENGPLRTWFEAKGVDVKIIKADRKLIELGSHVSFTQRLFTSLNLIRLVRLISIELQSHDLLYVNSKKSLLVGLLAAWQTHRPMIWHQRDEICNPATLPLRKRLSEKLLISLLNKLAAMVVSVSIATGNSFISAGGKAELVRVIYNGLAPGSYCPVSVNSYKLRSFIGIPEKAKLIGSFGRLTKWKGQRVLIEALSRVDNVHAVIVGDATFSERGYPEWLKRHAETLGIASRVHFLGYRDDVSMIMQEVDIVAHTSTDFDPCPRVVIEALHLGRPLVATSVGGVPELIENGKTGILIAPDDPAALANALKRILENDELAIRLGQEGRRQALDRFTINRVVTSVEEEINNLKNKFKFAEI